MQQFLLAVLLVADVFLTPTNGYGPPPSKNKHRTTTTTELPGGQSPIYVINPSATGPGTVDIPVSNAGSVGPLPSNTLNPPSGKSNYWWQGPSSPFNAQQPLPSVPPHATGQPTGAGSGQGFPPGINPGQGSPSNYPGSSTNTDNTHGIGPGSPGTVTQKPIDISNNPFLSNALGVRPDSSHQGSGPGYNPNQAISPTSSAPVVPGQPPYSNFPPQQQGTQQPTNVGNHPIQQQPGNIPQQPYNPNNIGSSSFPHSGTPSHNFPTQQQPGPESSQPGSAGKNPYVNNGIGGSTQPSYPGTSNPSLPTHQQPGPGFQQPIGNNNPYLNNALGSSPQSPPSNPVFPLQQQPGHSPEHSSGGNPFLPSAPGTNNFPSGSPQSSYPQTPSSNIPNQQPGKQPAGQQPFSPHGHLHIPGTTQVAQNQPQGSYPNRINNNNSGIGPSCNQQGYGCIAKTNCSPQGIALHPNTQGRAGVCSPATEVCCRLINSHDSTGNQQPHSAPGTYGPGAPHPGTNGVPIGGSIYDNQNNKPNHDAPPVTPTSLPYSGPLNTTPHPGCAAALKCVPISYCTAEGVMSDSPVQLTREQQENRVPLTECMNPETNVIGKCCRDPNYKDPWPNGMMMPNGDTDQDGHGPQPTTGNNNYSPQPNGPQPSIGNNNYNPQLNGPQPSIGNNYNPQPNGPQPPTGNNYNPQPNGPQPVTGNNYNPQPNGPQPPSTNNYNPGDGVHPEQNGNGPLGQPLPGLQPPQNGYGSQGQPLPGVQPQQNGYGPQGQPSPGVQPPQNGYEPQGQPLPGVQPSQNGYRPQDQPSHGVQPPQNSYRPQGQPSSGEQLHPSTTGSQNQPPAGNTVYSNGNIHQNTLPSTISESGQFPQAPGGYQPDGNTLGLQPPSPGSIPQSEQEASGTFSRPAGIYYNINDLSSTTGPSSIEGHRQHTIKKPIGNFNQKPTPFPVFGTLPGRQPAPVYENELPGQNHPLPSGGEGLKSPGQPVRPGPQHTGPAGTDFNRPNTSYNPSYQQPVHSSGLTCGVRGPPGNGAPEDAGVSEFPWQALVVSATNKELLCGAAIVSENAVITAAHCVENFRSKDLLIRVGEWKLYVPANPPVQVLPVVAIARHPHYNTGNRAQDLSLLIVGEPFILGPTVNKVCLPPPGQPLGSNEHRGSDAKCIATGWGRQALKGQSPNPVLHKVPVLFLKRDDCESTLKLTNFGKHFILQEGFTCILPKSTSDLCKVDVGGPVVCDRSDGQYELAGVNSWSVSCPTEEKKPTVLSEPDAEWIENALNTPVQQLQQEEEQYNTNKLKGESLDQTDIDQKPGFALGYGK